MAQPSKRHQQEKVINLVDFRGGIDWRRQSNEISDNSLALARNMDYDPISLVLVTRGGVKQHSTSAISGTHTLPGLFYYRNQDTLLVALGGTLYNYNRSTKSAASIGALTGSERPTFTEFNAKAIIASGGHLQSYDGSTLTTLTDSPSVCKYTGTRISRLITAGSSTYPDRLYFSAVGDETDWTDGGTTDDAKWIDIGYKDVSGDLAGFAFWQGNMILFKGHGTTYRMADFYPDWSPTILTANNSAVNHHVVADFGNNLYFLDWNGSKSFKTVMEYGDIQYSPIDKVNSRLKDVVESTCYGWTHYGRNQIWWRPNSNTEEIYVYHPVIDAFSRFRFDSSSCPIAGAYIDSEDTLYLLTADGHVATYSSAVDKDLGTAFTSTMQTKHFDFGRRDLSKLVKNFRFRGTGGVAGTGTYKIAGPSHSHSAGFSYSAGSEYVSGATEDVSAATQDVVANSDFTSITHQVVDGREIYFEIGSTTGRVEINEILCRVAATWRQ